MTLNVIGRAASSDIMVRVRPILSETAGAFLCQTFGITRRAGEVLGQIFTRIGVENRTPAAAMAIRSLETGQKLYKADPLLLDRPPAIG